MRSILEQVARRTGKFESFQLDPDLTSIDFWGLTWHLFRWYVRGLKIKYRLNRANGLVLCGRGVRILHPRYVSAGKNLILEDQTEIIGFSRKGICFGDNVTIGAFSIIRPSNYYGRFFGEGLQIGNYSSIGCFSYIGCSGYVTIGNNVLISPKVSLIAENHNFEKIDIPIRDQGIFREPIQIQDNCWIATNSVILPGVTIGEGSIIGAGSVVNCDIPKFSIAAGVPARVIRKRKNMDD